MKKGKTGRRAHKRAGARKEAEPHAPGPAPKLRPGATRTYELTVMDGEEPELVRMSAREIFEANCPGAAPEAYEEMKEEEIRAKMLDLADRLALFEERWHPQDVEVVADACTDFIIEMRESSRLDSAAAHTPKADTPAARK